MSVAEAGLLTVLPGQRLFLVLLPILHCRTVCSMQATSLVLFYARHNNSNAQFPHFPSSVDVFV